MIKRLIKFLIPAVVAVFIGCQLSTPDEYYDTLSIELASEVTLSREINNATNTIRVALRELNGVLIKAALTTAAENGVTVEVMLDNDSVSSTNGLSPLISCRFGNRYGILDSNFFIIDGMIYQVTSSDLDTDQFILLKMSDDDMLWDYNMEFSQMYNDSNFAYGSDSEDAKIRHNYIEQYSIGPNLVEVYFNPAQPALEHLKTRIGNAKYTTDWFVEYIEHREIYLLWKDMAGAGISNTIKMGKYCSANIDDYPDLINSAGSVSVYTENMGYNAVFVDKDYRSGCVIITSFDLTNHRTVRQSDGVLVIVSGPAVTNLYKDLKVNTILKSETNVSVIQLNLSTNIQYQNIIFNEIVRRGMTNGVDGMRYALAKMIELKNRTTNWYDLSGCTIIITNANRTAEPSSYVVPYGTILPPNGYYVLASVNYAFAYYDEHWDGFYLDRSFTLTFLDSHGGVIDHIGNIQPDGFYDNIFNGYYGESIIRNTTPLQDGTQASHWSSYTGVPINLYSEFATVCHATPGVN